MAGKVKENFVRISLGKIKNIICLTKKTFDEKKNLLPVSVFLSMLDV